MSAIVMVLLGMFVGIFAMTMIRFYKWFLHTWNSGLR